MTFMQYALMNAGMFSNNWIVVKLSSDSLEMAND